MVARTMKPDIQTSSPDASLQDKLLIVSACQGCVYVCVAILTSRGPSASWQLLSIIVSPSASYHPIDAGICIDMVVPASPTNYLVKLLTGHRVCAHSRRLPRAGTSELPTELHHIWKGLQYGMQMLARLRKRGLRSCKPVCKSDAYSIACLPSNRVEAGQEVEWRLRGHAGRFPVGWFALQNCKRLQ